MPTSRVLGTLGLLVLAVTAWTRADARKEFVRLQLSSPSGALVRVHVATHGLIILEPQSRGGQPPAEVSTTISTPITLTLAGIGEAHVEVVDSTTTLNVDVTQVRANAPPVQHLTGRAFRIGRSAYTEPYRVSVIEHATISERH
ncbi:MAG TPA: hypothetical protein VFI52_06440 [Gemmatimonadaceae bacterium]|nr:hypothetical protein [Gemmatimonadaceae bacterium]